MMKTALLLVSILLIIIGVAALVLSGLMAPVVYLPFIIVGAILLGVRKKLQ